LSQRLSARLNPNQTTNAPNYGAAWVFIQSVLLLAVVVLGVVDRGDWTRIWLITGGAAMFVAGGAIGVAGVGVLGRNRTPFPQPRADSELVQHGIYAHLRHPLYTSVMLASFGWALIWQSGAAAVAALVLVPFLLAKARHEERWLRVKFPGYADYARRVPAFLPRVRLRPHRTR
jgi:protein-S-isoprenylcysteine O-methyltransferase Ste14